MNRHQSLEAIAQRVAAEIQSGREGRFTTVNNETDRRAVVVRVKQILAGEPARWEDADD